MDYELYDEINSFLPKLLLVVIFITATESKLGLAACVVNQLWSELRGRMA